MVACLLTHVQDTHVREQLEREALKPHRFGGDFHVLRCLLTLDEREIRNVVTDDLYDLCMKAKAQGIPHVLSRKAERAAPNVVSVPRSNVSDGVCPSGRNVGKPWFTLTQADLLSSLTFFRDKCRDRELSERVVAEIENVLADRSAVYGGWEREV